jgi:hypothetical protein
MSSPPGGILPFKRRISTLPDSKLKLQLLNAERNIAGYLHNIKKGESFSSGQSLQIKAHSTTEAHVITSNCTAERKSLKKKNKGMYSHSKCINELWNPGPK